MCFKLYKEKRGKELDDEAKKLGVPIDDIRQTREGYGDTADVRIQERIRSAKNAKYARLTWIIALTSAFASVISAIAAWYAILQK